MPHRDLQQCTMAKSHSNTRNTGPKRANHHGGLVMWTRYCVSLTSREAHPALRAWESDLAKYIEHTVHSHRVSVNSLFQSYIQIASCRSTPYDSYCNVKTSWILEFTLLRTILVIGTIWNNYTYRNYREMSTGLVAEARVAPCASPGHICVSKFPTWLGCTVSTTRTN
jgi:hypothetical protein